MLCGRMHDLLTATGGGAGVVMLEGEAGIGKSRIIEELLFAGLPECGGKGHLLFGRADAASKSQVCQVFTGEVRYRVQKNCLFHAQKEKVALPINMAHAQVLHPWRQPLQALFHHDSAASRRAFADSSWGARCRDRIADYEVRHSLQSCMDMQ